MSTLQRPSDPLLAIGGVGGSGTRVVAAAAKALGIHIGDDLNGPLDNLTFTLLFKDAAVIGLGQPALDARMHLFKKAMHGDTLFSKEDERLLDALVLDDRPSGASVQHPRDWLQQRAGRIRSGQAGHALLPGARWGWKEPNTHVLMPRLMERFPGLRYVHVVRNGLDMAFSSNLNQLRFWGDQYLGRPVVAGPRDALTYWCVVHRRAMDWQRRFGPRFLWLDFDALCREPLPVLRQLSVFLGESEEAAEGLLHLVEPPASQGRAVSASLDAFNPMDLDFLRQIGHLH